MILSHTILDSECAFVHEVLLHTLVAGVPRVECATADPLVAAWMLDPDDTRPRELPCASSRGVPGRLG